MDIDVFSPDELPVVMRVLRTALRTEGRLDDGERIFLATYARIASFSVEPNEIDPITGTEMLLVRVHGAHRAKRLLQLAAIAVLFSRPVRPSSFAFLRRLAAHLRAHDEVIDVIEALTRGRKLRVRFLTMRRGLKGMFAEAYESGGIRGVLEFGGAMFFGLAGGRSTLPRYKRLGLLPEGTLGRAYWTHMTERDFGFPGEPGGIAQNVVYHDVAHVLAGHDTTPFGEIQQGSFQGGNRRDGGFFFIQFVVLHFHQGVKITPAADPETGNFHPAKVLWAIHRGAQCPVDMTHGWDFWPLMQLPIADARAQCGLLPPYSLQGASR